MDSDPSSIVYHRPRWLVEPPEHFCTACRSVLYEDDLVCVECGAPRPEQGWLMCRDVPRLLLGRALDGRYLVTRHIGRGSFAQVYRVLSLSVLRPQAIKVIDLSALSSDEAQQTQRRLTREIDILGRLNNPHIVSASDVFSLDTQEQLIVIVMNLIRGQTLYQLVRQEGPLTLERAIPIIHQLLLALSSAHQAQVIHRDLKPDNVMVERLNFGVEFVHLLDFGMAIAQDYRRISQGFAGTPLFASPEQVKARQIDYRSDVYSLGALIFFLLTGHPPFQGETIMEVMSKHMYAPIPRLSDAAPLARFSPMLEALVQRMLAKKPEDRPSSLEEIRASLAALAPEGGPLPSSAPPALPQAQAQAAPMGAAPRADALIVEVDEERAALLMQVVQAAGLQPHRARHVGQAVELFVELQPDLVLLALTLDEGSGLQVCRRVRQLSQVPIVIVSGREEDAAVLAAFEAGADDAVSDPIQPDLLLARLGALLQRA